MSLDSGPLEAIGRAVGEASAKMHDEMPEAERSKAEALAASSIVLWVLTDPNARLGYVKSEMKADGDLSLSAALSRLVFARFFAGRTARENGFVGSAPMEPEGFPLAE